MEETKRSATWNLYMDWHSFPVCIDLQPEKTKRKKKIVKQNCKTLMKIKRWDKNECENERISIRRKT